MSKVYSNLLSTQNNITSQTTLTVVTKKHSMDRISQLIKRGHKYYAENYVQEAKEKWHEIPMQHHDICLKLIGRLQSNKIQDALNIFHEIHSIHSLEIAEKIHKALDKTSLTNKFYAQINIGNEVQKSGIAPQDIIDFLEKCPLEISGIMCIPPYKEEPSPYFLLMQNIKRNVHRYMGKNLKLSMGMSIDYRKAVILGSDEVRIGSAILGERF